jgi:hypothetical protein
MGRVTRQYDWIGNGSNAGYDRQVFYNDKGQVWRRPASPSATATPSARSSITNMERATTIPWNSGDTNSGDTILI